VTPPGECGQRAVQKLGVNMHANLLLPRGPSAHGIEVRRSICVRRSNERRIGLASFTVGLRPNALDVWSYTASMVRGSSRSHTCCWEVRDVECPHGLNLVSLLAWNQERSKPTGGTSPKRRPANPHSRVEKESPPDLSQPLCGGGGIAMPEEGLGLEPQVSAILYGHGRRHAFRVFTKRRESPFGPPDCRCRACRSAKETYAAVAHSL
jgi:hypothetical protein